MTSNSRFVGVIAGLGTCNTSSCTGSKNTTPDTPTGDVTMDNTRPATTHTAAIDQDTAWAVPGQWTTDAGANFMAAASTTHAEVMKTFNTDPQGRR